MTTASQNTFYARPVYLSGEERHSLQNQSNQPVKSVTFAPPKNGRLTEASILPTRRKFSELENAARRAMPAESLSPPPRPPPPRPSRAPKTPENKMAAPPARPTPEPKPLTRINVTDHDQLWLKETDNENLKNGPSDILSPPLGFITPQTTEEMWKNYDPLDEIDSLSDRSDSSADTMIMMTSEEEKRNMEKINHSLVEYTSVKSKHDGQNTNRLKVDIQSKKSLQFSDKNGLVNGQSVVLNGIITPDRASTNKVTPLHIRTDNGSSPESDQTKGNSTHGSPNDDSPDDGYGTNSSCSTVASPFSSSFGSSDLENSCNGPFKRPILPNGAIKPNSVRESWAVKRKQRMIEAQDNSVQEQLRQLTIIEEESGGQGAENSRLSSHSASVSSDNKLRHGVNEARKGRSDINKVEDKNSPNLVLGNGGNHDSGQSSGQDRWTDSNFVNVSQRDLVRRSGQLYVVDNESVSEPTNTRPERTKPQPQAPSLPPRPHFSTNEINAPRVPPHHHGNDSGEIIYDQVYVPSNGVLPRRDYGSSNNTRWENNIEFSESVESAPLVLPGGFERQRTLSGKIYVSPNGDEGFYSLNRSSRSTSVSSFQPINEVVDGFPEQTNSSEPQSPLEAFSGDMLEKWTEMDINYRNYYGFEEQTEKYSRTDSKVNYFQEKKINTLYGQDNYYRPPNYGPEVTQVQGNVSGQELANQGILRDSRREVQPRDHRDSVQRPSTSKGQKSNKESGTSKSKLFQILPNMFKPSTKKMNVDAKGNKEKQRPTISAPIHTSSSNLDKPPTDALDNEAEYINIGDLPQYSLASIEYEEKLKKGQFVSLDSLVHKRPVFASSKDINKLFSRHDQSFDSLHHPGTQRHSFHAMPLSYRHVASDMGSGDSMRPRAQSTSATIRSQQLRNSVESRMEVISRKNATVMNQARIAASSNSLRTMSHRVSGSRTRLDSGNSGSSGGDSKLSTLV